MAAGPTAAPFAARRLGRRLAVAAAQPRRSSAALGDLAAVGRAGVVRRHGRGGRRRPARGRRRRRRDLRPDHPRRGRALPGARRACRSPARSTPRRGRRCSSPTCPSWARAARRSSPSTTAAATAAPTPATPDGSEPRLDRPKTGRRRRRKRRRSAPATTRRTDVDRRGHEPRGDDEAARPTPDEPGAALRRPCTTARRLRRGPDRHAGRRARRPASTARTAARHAHAGKDIAAPTGTAVRAAQCGTVTKAGADGGGYGNLVCIQHEGGVSTCYAHLSQINTKGLLRPRRRRDRQGRLHRLAAPARTCTSRSARTARPSTRTPYLSGSKSIAGAPPKTAAGKPRTARSP